MLHRARPARSRCTASSSARYSCASSRNCGCSPVRLSVPPSPPAPRHQTRAAPPSRSLPDRSALTSPLTIAGRQELRPRRNSSRAVVRVMRALRGLVFTFNSHQVCDLVPHLRIFHGDALRFEWAVGALPRPQVRLALRPLLPVPVLRPADDPGFAQRLDLLRRILPLVFRRRPEGGRQRAHILEDQIPIRHVGTRLFKPRAVFAVLPQAFTWLQSSCPGKLAPDKADVAGMIALQGAEPFVDTLHGEQLLRKPIDRGVMHAIQLILEEADLKLPRLAVVSGLVGHLDADRLVAAQLHRVKVDLDPVALEFLLRLLELPALLVVIPHLHIVAVRLLAPAGFVDDLF